MVPYLQWTGNGAGGRRRETQQLLQIQKIGKAIVRSVFSFSSGVFQMPMFNCTGRASPAETSGALDPRGPSPLPGFSQISSLTHVEQLRHARRGPLPLSVEVSSFRFACLFCQCSTHDWGPSPTVLPITFQLIPPCGVGPKHPLSACRDAASARCPRYRRAGLATLIMIEICLDASKRYNKGKFTENFSNLLSTTLP